MTSPLTAAATAGPVLPAGDRVALRDWPAFEGAAFEGAAFEGAAFEGAAAEGAAAEGAATDARGRAMGDRDE